MDMSIIQGTIAGLKLAGDIAKGLLELKTLSEVRGKVSELQNALLSAQTSAIEANAAQFSMVEEIRALKEEMARMKAWNSEKQRYQLYAPWNGAVVYALKKTMSNSEPPHWICTNCYEDGKKSILTQQMTTGFVVEFLCPSCGCRLRALERHRHGYPLKYAE